MLRPLALALASTLAVACTPAEPHDLGDHPADQVRLADSPLLAYLGAAYAGGDQVTLAELLGEAEPDFKAAPDPSAILELQRAEHAALPAIDDGVHLRVLTQNLGLLDRWYPFTHVGVAEVDRRREHVPPLLFAEGYDVLLLQEVWEDIDLERIRLAAEDRGYRVYGGSSKHHIEHGLAIAVREELIDPDGEERVSERTFEQLYDVERFPGPGVARGFIGWSFVHAPTGRRIHLVDTHVAAYADAWRNRTFQAREVALHVRQLPADEIVVLGGDFNAGPYYPEDRFGDVGGEPVGEWWRNTIMYPVILHYGEVFETMAAFGAADDVAAMDGLPAYDAVAWDREPYGDASICEGPKTAFSWDWCDTLAFEAGGATEYPARLDFVFVRDRGDDVRVVDAHLANTEPVMQGDRAVEISDHYGSAATLRIRSAR